MTTMPPDRKLLEIDGYTNGKYDGTQRSRTVAQLYSQVPVKIFSNIHAPFMMDVAIRVALIFRIITKLQFDIETTFLYSELDEEIFIRTPEGSVTYMLEVQSSVIDPPTQFFFLQKPIIGLVYAERY
jgi:Reverse transcriptase (RNA-dependent DNA polymerase)